jgi:gliding motility-associated-like protein
MKTKIIYFLLFGISLLACKKEAPPAPKPVLFDVVIARVTVTQDTSFCVSKSDLVELIAPTDSVDSHQWFPGGDTASSKLFSTPGNYSLILNRYGKTDTLHISVKSCAETIIALYVPNSFAPDGDGQNDKWGPKGTGIASIYFEVRNQDGVIVFSSTSLDNLWDGKWKGQENTGPSGFYMYYIEYTDIKGVFKKLSGSLELIR